MKVTPILCLIAFLLSLHADATESIKVEVVGILNGGVMAIGSETTGTTITAKGVTWELALGDFRKKALKLDGKAVHVRGELERRKGVEIKERWIVRVSALEAAKPKQVFKVGPLKGDSRIDVSGQLIDVHSKGGMGKVTITRLAATWPTDMRVRLHLRGLESFKVQSGKRELEWSVSNGQKKLTRVAVREDGKEIGIKPGDPLYTEVGTMGGVYDVLLPKALFEGNPKEITLRWIDFYR